MTEIRTILFDLDGTLADTAPDLAASLNRLRLERGMDPLAFAAIRPHVSNGANALLRVGFDAHPGDAGFDALRKRFLEIYLENICDQTTLFAGMPELLQRITAKGLNWGIVTNKPAYLTDPLVEQLGVDRDAVCVISGDTTNNRKPHPEPMLHACELAGSTPAQCVYVGDAHRDIEAGKQAGTHTLVALFGYIAEDEDPAAWGADAMIQTPGEIMNWIEAHA